MAAEYFDKYRFESDPVLLRDIAVELARLLPADIDGLAGLELGGVPIATALSAHTGLPAFFVRKEAKAYGTEKVCEGGDVGGLRLVVVEDVVTTGGQIVLSTQDLRDTGAVVRHAVCVIDRESGAASLLSGEGLELASLFTMSALRSSEAPPGTP
jgi:orotate phosphoribosyltransferase